VPFLTSVPDPLLCLRTACFVLPADSLLPPAASSRRRACGMSILLPRMRKGTVASASSLSSESSSFFDSVKRSRSTASTRNTIAST